ncbi:NADPH:quinone reductase-like Zn-dependent oxidoreductase [Mycolicibacterium sp. BK634]|uniref:zinc-binding dehydrogenase n=1 Tax=Mycolicibacterium sp. BK634 TaxID=2587099 RepID=UPI00161B5377|nr:NADPH:quinone reductase-like Zn-dependent oxidoreductase [Mycolicibacterium sp. BK634]
MAGFRISTYHWPTEGATVPAAARGADKLALARQLGAYATIDYSEPEWPKTIRKCYASVDIALDGVGGLLGHQIVDLVTEGGTFSGYGMAAGTPTVVDGDIARARNVEALTIEQLNPYQTVRPTRVARLLAMAARGEIAPVIGASFPLSDAAAAHRALRDRALLGKAILRP